MNKKGLGDQRLSPGQWLVARKFTKISITTTTTT